MCDIIKHESLYVYVYIYIEMVQSRYDDDYELLCLLLILDSEHTLV